MEPAVLVPVKSFRAAKRRLAGFLSDVERRRLAEWMATRVVAAAAPLPVFVACDDDEVAAWAEVHGAAVLWGPGLGLNGAVDQGVATIAGKGFDHVVVAHGDLPLPNGIGALLTPGRITLVPDRHLDGTNVVSRPTAIAFPAAYGGGSFGRHVSAARTLGSALAVCHHAELAIDLDTVDDCRHPRVVPVLETAGFAVAERRR